MPLLSSSSTATTTTSTTSRPLPTSSPSQNAASISAASASSTTKRRKVIILTGAPLAKDLRQQDSRYKLLDDFSPLFKALLNGTSLPDREALDSSTQQTRWRLLPAQANSHLPTGLTQPTQSSFNEDVSFQDPAANRGGISFLSSMTSTSDANTTFDSILQAATQESEATAKQYLTHSFKRHQAMRANHLDSTILDGSFTSSFNTQTDSLSMSSFPSTLPTSTNIRASSLQPPQKYLPPSTTITPLSSLPTPSHLHQIHPQTPTPTLLVTLLSCTPRSVNLRLKQPNHSMPSNPAPVRHLLEVLLADPTHAPFKATFWLPPGQVATPPPSGRPRKPGDPVHRSNAVDVPFHQLSALRPGTILLVHRLMLTPYNNATCGQNLNPRTTGLRTRVDVLMDERGRDRVGLEGEWAQRVKEVREWTEKFVGVVVTKRPVEKTRGAKGNAKKRHFLEDLPDDSLV